MKRVVKASQEELVDVFVKPVDGNWRILFEQIPESQAIALWEAGFATGQNRFSIRNEVSKRIDKMNRAALGIRD